jgi:Excalibur calcium-binding domain
MYAALARSAIAMFLFALTAGHALAASQVNKCVIDGKVTYQSGPCASDRPSRQPTVEELNAARKKRLAEAAAQTPPAPAATSTPYPGTKPSESSAPAPLLKEQAYKCDGRTHCSQMRSCSEAKYFLANCPGVKMDGNRDGTPCEQQWCTHPGAK